MKKKKCKICKSEFKPLRPLQQVCSYTCANEYTKQQKQKQWNKEKKVLKEKLMTKKDYLKIAQKVFNTYIRLRDKNKNCISCDKPLTTKNMQAGHFFSVGAYPNLRFNENNVFGQCIECNLHKHGNVKEYDLRLQKLLSDTEYQKLLEDRNKPLKLDITEVKEFIKLYRKKIKELK